MSLVAKRSGVIAGDTPNTLFWWLKDPKNKVANQKLSLAPGTFDTNSQDRQNVVTINGRPDPIILNDVVGLPSITFQLVFTSDAAYQKFEKLRNTQRTLLFQGPYPSGQWYIRLGLSEDVKLNLPTLRGWASSGVIVRTIQVTAQAVAAP